jgi:hypothetical protein
MVAYSSHYYFVFAAYHWLYKISGYMTRFGR